jgi:hypothetical protein
MSGRSPGEVSFYLGLATAIATFSAAAVALGLLHCSRTRERVIAAGVLLCATLGIAAALATVARGQSSGLSNILIGGGVVVTAAYVLFRALRFIFTERDASPRRVKSLGARSSSTQDLPIIWSSTWASGDWSRSAASGAESPLLSGSAPGRLLRGQLGITTVGFASIIVLAAVVALPDLFEGFLRSRPVGGANVQSDPGVIAASAVPDLGAGPPWALRVFTNRAGLECVAVGRLLDGALGTYDTTRAFHKLPADVPGSCEPVGRSGLLVTVQRRGLPEKRTITYGLAPEGAPVRVTIGGKTRTLQPGVFGNFLDVRPGVPNMRGASASTTVAGRAISRRLG